MIVNGDESLLSSRQVDFFDVATIISPEDNVNPDLDQTPPETTVVPSDTLPDTVLYKVIVVPSDSLDVPLIAEGTVPKQLVDVMDGATAVRVT